MAIIIVAAASYTFPLYLVPLCFLIMGGFSYYIYGKKEKGTTFLITIYVLMGLNALILLAMSIVRLMNKNPANSSLFYA
jgi:hypothetical protein